MYVMDLASGEQHRVSTGKGRTTCGYFYDGDRRVLWASTHADGGLYLTLVPPDNQPAAIPPVDNSNLFQGGLTPYEG